MMEELELELKLELHASRFQSLSSGCGRLAGLAGKHLRPRPRSDPPSRSPPGNALAAAAGSQCFRKCKFLPSPT